MNVIKRIYEAGRNATDQMKERIRKAIQFANFLPKWNYKLTPQTRQLFIESPLHKIV